MSAVECLVPGARHAVAPAGIVSTAWPRVKNTCRNIGWRFDPWQDATGRLILAKKSSGEWAADLSILSIPRQVGKSYLLGCIIFALCLLNPRLRVIWTSHHTATTEEMFEAMKGLAEHPRVKPHVVKSIALQGSRWRIVFRNGSRIDFGARERGFGRGKAKVGVLVLDEFQHISARALANLTPTTNTADNPLILCAGTPPGPNDPAEAFKLRRKGALEGFTDDTLYVEFSADTDAAADDRKQWAKANPSFPKRTKERAFLLNRKMLEEPDFKREMLGIWDDEGRDLSFEAAYMLGADPRSEIDGQAFFAVSMSKDLQVALLAVGKRRDGLRHLEVVESGHANGLFGPEDAPFPARVAQVTASAAVWLCPTHPVGSIQNALKDAGCRIETLNGTEYAQGCVGLYKAFLAGEVRYPPPQDTLAEAVRNATQKKSGDTWKWAGDGITSLVAASQAFYAASEGPSVYESRGLAVL